MVMPFIFDFDVENGKILSLCANIVGFTIFLVLYYEIPN